MKKRALTVAVVVYELGLNDINVVVRIVSRGVSEHASLAILRTSVPFKSALVDLDLLIVFLTSRSLQHLELKNGGLIRKDTSEA